MEGSGMAVKIAITNEKGGCGKTTTAVNVSSMLSERGFRVLLIDADPQSYATMYYGLHDRASCNLYDVLRSDAGQKDEVLEQAILRSSVFKKKKPLEGTFAVDVLCSHTKLKQIERDLVLLQENNRPYASIMKERLSVLDEAYDFILIDCPPQGYNLLDAIHVFADYVLVPMIPDEFALHSLRIKVEELIDIRSKLNPRLRLLGGLLIMDEKSGTKAAYKDALLSQTAFPFFRATVRKNIALSRAINANEPINVYARSSNGCFDYEAVTDELLGRAQV